MANYQVGTQVTSRASFSARPSDGGALADPTEVALYVEPPDGVVATYLLSLLEVDHDGTGLFSKTLDIDQAGEWKFLWVGSGGGPIVRFCGVIFVDDNCVTVS